MFRASQPWRLGHRLQARGEALCELSHLLGIGLRTRLVALVPGNLGRHARVAGEQVFMEMRDVPSDDGREHERRAKLVLQRTGHA